MNSETVYQVAKALPREEQLLLFEKLKNDFLLSKTCNKIKNPKLKKEEAIHYLLTRIFCKKGKIV
jgi:hypothetical protein